MLAQLKTAAKVVGVKQSKKVIREGGALGVFIAQDAENRVTAPIYDLCREMSVPVTEVATMSELGEAAQIDVGAAVVVMVKD